MMAILSSGVAAVAWRVLPVRAVAPTFEQQILPMDCVFTTINSGTGLLEYVTPKECGVVVPPAPTPTPDSSTPNGTTAPSTDSGAPIFLTSYPRLQRDKLPAVSRRQANAPGTGEEAPEDNRPAQTTTGTTSGGRSLALAALLLPAGGLLIGLAIMFTVAYRRRHKRGRDY